MTPLSLTKFWQHLNWVFFLHKKKSIKKMLGRSRYFLLQDYWHFKWRIMVFTTFGVYKRFQILFVHILVSLASPLKKTNEPTHMEEKKKAQSEQLCRIRNIRLLPAKFTQVKQNVPVRELEGKPSGTKICTKRIRNLVSTQKVVRSQPIILKFLLCTKTRVSYRTRVYASQENAPSMEHSHGDHVLG